MQTSLRRHVAVVTGAVLVAGAGVVMGARSAASTPAATPSSTVWLCRPGLADNPCEHDLTTTVVRADGTKKVVHPRPAKRPPIDCFYVYPTVSGQPTTNADLTIDPEEIAVAEQQASRFSSVCRVFAPMYRQITIAGLGKILGGDSLSTSARETAYQDVVDAWRDYLAHDNHGRGVVFIGHSQGTSVLTHLLKDEVDPKRALRRRVVSALLIGFDVTVPVGEDVGGSFEHIPACRANDQTGCVVAYSSFNEVPPPDSLFGRVRPATTGSPAGENLEVLCVNPAHLAGGSGALVAYFRTAPFPSTLGAVEPPQYKADTPWVQVPKLYTAECEQAEGASWLQVDPVGTAGDQRPLVRTALGPTWGLHLVDVTLALGNLVDLVRAQERAYASAQ